MVAIPTLAPQIKDPWVMAPITELAANLLVYNGAASANLSTTAAFTGFAQMGIQDNTDWVANTFKTVFSHTGRGLVYGLIGCTAGGAETTTFEITLDSVLSTITITNASGERAALITSSLPNGDEFTTANVYSKLLTGLDAATLTTYQGGASGQFIPSIRSMEMLGIPALRYNFSCLIRMKHSTSITNSVATSYSAVMVRKGIAA